MSAFVKDAGESAALQRTGKSTPLIACSLLPDALRDRLEWIAVLNREYLREMRSECTTLHLSYDARAAGRVQELVGKERECCGFLRFTLWEMPTGIELRIDAPADLEMDAAPLFAPFLSGT